MAEITLSEFHEIRLRQSVQDFKHLLDLLERDEIVLLVDDPEPAEAEVELSSVVDEAPTPGEDVASLHPSEPDSTEGADLTDEPAPPGSVVDTAPAEQDGENADQREPGEESDQAADA